MATRLLPPLSRMGPLTADEFQKEFAESDLMREYGTAVNRESAYEMLAKRIEQSAPPAAGSNPNTPYPERRAPSRGPGRVAKAAGAAAVIAGVLKSSMARTVGRELIRGIFGMLTGKPPRGTTRRR
jgi:hypothetical protein